MFTGIIEATGVVKKIQSEGSNRRLVIESSIADQLKASESVSHNGVCLTIESVIASAAKQYPSYEVVAIQETLNRSNLGELKEGDLVNLERSLKLGDRMDGHFVQGHVDETALCKSVINENGSYVFTFESNDLKKKLVVEKGSISINGVSLTISALTENTFSVSIIPYTFGHTNFKSIRVGDKVNIEYDLFGKYVQRIMELG